ncbi:MAG: polysaccharide deacetylase family protein [Halofilum sp. (in: g-proteobacteria)]
MSSTSGALSSATASGDNRGSVRARCWLVALAGLLFTPVVSAASGVVLEYHHVADGTPPSTSVTPKKFEAHMDHLAENDFNVWPLPKLVETAREGGDIPERTVAITFDDAYASVYDEVFPRLQERGWPFTVFVATDAIGKGIDAYTSWDELREMEAAGVTIGNHSVDHAHMVARGDRDRAQWLADARANIVDAEERLNEELASPARLFAWPFGEFSPPLQRLLAELDYVGFGQQSGAVGPHSDFTALPRFPLATGFDSLDSFALKVRSRPLPVAKAQPPSGVLGPEAERPTLTLELGPGPYRPETVRCYIGGGPAAIGMDAGSTPVLRVRPTQTLGTGRTKINCTAPATQGSEWFWYSYMWMKPNPDGTWYRD